MPVSVAMASVSVNIGRWTFRKSTILLVMLFIIWFIRHSHVEDALQAAQITKPHETTNFPLARNSSVVAYTDSIVGGMST